MISWLQLESFVKTAIRILKDRRRNQAAFFVAALCFSVGFALTRKLIPDFNTDGWFARVQIALYGIGAVALVYAVVRVWRLVNPPELPPAKDRPSAIKGPAAFTEADGELFRKLGRESELRKLLGFVKDDQVLIVVVRGASGAGKTSLLRAGLKNILDDDAVLHYWESIPAEPGKGLLRAIRAKWPEAVAKPSTLPELVNPSDRLGRQCHVIVLDQFEQLRGSQEIFELLRRIINESKPPHRITWVIAFRSEFSDDWLDFISPEQEKGLRLPKDVPLKLFTVEQAREVIGQLINESDLKASIEQSVIDNLIEAATVNGEVSPVDISIGLLVLTELHERQSSKTITIRDYQFAGGAEGLLTQYISRCLEPFPKQTQEAILKAMLALRDPEENRQRLSTGLTIDALAVEASTDARALRPYLNRLADRDVRLLEADTPTDGSEVRYRLPHERLIPALSRLTGKLLAEVDQAKLKFQNAFHAWRTNDKRWRYLLTGSDLRLVQRYETQIPWGQDEQEKKSFLFRSKRFRQFAWVATMTALLALIGIDWFAMRQYQRYEYRRYLTESGYPAELYDFQHQLKKLEMTEPLNLEHFSWLSSDSIEELSLKAANSSNSIAGLTSLSRCRSLKKLSLDLRNSEVSDLKPLAQLQGLTQLTLRLRQRQITDLKPLTRLRELMIFTLDLSNNPESDLRPLKQLKDLQQLTLYINEARMSDWEILEQLEGLTQPTLSLQIQQRTPLRQLNRLRDLKGLAQLRELTLDLRDSQGGDLHPLEGLQQLTRLTIDFSFSEVPELMPLNQLKALKQLTLNLKYSQARDSALWETLKTLTQSKQLSLNLSTDYVSDLQSLGSLKGLTQLTLSISGQPRDVQFPESLKELTELTLFVTGGQLSDLQGLERLKSLTQLTLVPIGGQLSDLQGLDELNTLTQLTLVLSDSHTGDLQSLEKLNRPIQLSLDLSSSHASNLQSLKKLNGLVQLSVDLRGSQMGSFELLQELISLQKLSVKNATRAQRMSLRNIPSSLIELKF